MWPRRRIRKIGKSCSQYCYRWTDLLRFKLYVIGCGKVKGRSAIPTKYSTLYPAPPFACCGGSSTRLIPNAFSLLREKFVPKIELVCIICGRLTLCARSRLQGRKRQKVFDRDSTRNCNRLITQRHRSQTRYHCATRPVFILLVVWNKRRYCMFLVDSNKAHYTIVFV